MLVTLEPENLFYMTGFWGEAIGILEKIEKSVKKQNGIYNFTREESIKIGEG